MERLQHPGSTAKEGVRMTIFKNAGGAGKNVKDWKILILQLQLNTNYH